MSTDNSFGTSPVGATGDDVSSTGASGRAQQAAGTAADESGRVAGVAREEAQRVAGEAKSHASDLLNQAASQVEEQSRTQRDRLVETLRTVGDDLDKMASQSEGGIASNLARDGADRARSISSRLDGREPRDLLDDVRAFARRKPGTFLLGALAAGVVAGRVTRGAKDARSGSNGSSNGQVLGSGPNAAHGTSTGSPLAGTGFPASDPAYPEGTDQPAVTPVVDPAAPVAPLPGESTRADIRPGGLA